MPTIIEFVADQYKATPMYPGLFCYILRPISISLLLFENIETESWKAKLTPIPSNFSSYTQ